MANILYIYTYVSQFPLLITLLTPFKPLNLKMGTRRAESLPS